VSEIVPGIAFSSVIAGKYRVDRVLGKGGMGVVVSAHHIGLDTRVAIKFLLSADATQEAHERFAREARAAAKISNEHVARVFDVGELENGAPYMVMELLDGSDVGALLAQQGPLRTDLAVDFVLQACEAIAEAHSLGIVHRDLKPANLFCVRRPDGSPCIKVLDFGISKVTNGMGSGGVSMTATNALMGTPLYMSPEQMGSSRDIDGRADIWALGVIAFELLSGRVPFPGDTLPEVCINVMSTPPPSLGTLRPDLPLGLQAAVQRCLAKNRDERFSSVAELAQALAPFGPPRAGMSVDRIRGTLDASAIAWPASRDATVAAPTPSRVASNPSFRGGISQTIEPFGASHGGSTRGTSRFGVIALVLVGAITLVAASTVAYWHYSAAPALSAARPPLSGPSATEPRAPEPPPMPVATLPPLSTPEEPPVATRLPFAAQTPASPTPRPAAARPPVAKSTAAVDGGAAAVAPAAPRARPREPAQGAPEYDERL
jgi:eukaryotic-like serine/threonine-protein kinase